jgi:hypothetical protein
MLRLFSSCLCAAAILTASAPAMAKDITQGLQQTVQPSAEWSAASKKKRKRAVTVYPDEPYAYYAPARAYGWRPADPSFDQDGRPYRNPFPGQCMVDLGYGRWESCNQVR